MLSKYTAKCQLYIRQIIKKSYGRSSTMYTVNYQEIIRQIVNYNTVNYQKTIRQTVNYIYGRPSIIYTAKCQKNIRQIVKYVYGRSSNMYTAKCQEIIRQIVNFLLKIQKSYSFNTNPLIRESAL